jgi:hypothetical protein
MIYSKFLSDLYKNFTPYKYYGWLKIVHLYISRGSAVDTATGYGFDYRRVGV